MANAGITHQPSETGNEKTLRITKHVLPARSCSRCPRGKTRARRCTSGPPSVPVETHLSFSQSCLCLHVPSLSWQISADFITIYSTPKAAVADSYQSGHLRLVGPVDEKLCNVQTMSFLTFSFERLSRACLGKNYRYPSIWELRIA